MPPIAAAIGSAAARRLARWPTVNSRLISRPTTRKNTVSSASLTQCSSDSRNSAVPSTIPASCCQNAVNPGPRGEFVSTIARTVASSSKRPAEGAQPAKSSAATRTRCPRVPSIASLNELSSQAPS